MKLYLLEGNDDWIQTVQGFVVRAESPEEARELASMQAGDEGWEAWLDDRRSTCEPLREDGPACIIMRDFG